MGICFSSQEEVVAVDHPSFGEFGKKPADNKPSLKDHTNVLKKGVLDQGTRKVSRASFTRQSIDRRSTRRSSVDRRSTRRSSVDRYSARRPSVDRHSATRKSVDRYSARRPSVDRHSATRKSVDRHSARRPSVDRHSATRKSVDRHSARRQSAHSSDGEKKFISYTRRSGETTPSNGKDYINFINRSSANTEDIANGTVAKPVKNRREETKERFFNLHSLSVPPKSEMGEVSAEAVEPRLVTATEVQQIGSEATEETGKEVEDKQD